jgi:hypothetical protein
VCLNCVSNVDTMAVASSGIAALASGGWQRLVDRVHGLSPRERRQRTWEDDAAFLASLGHDPEVLLGPPPARERVHA